MVTMVEDSIEIAAELIKSFEGLMLVKYKCSGDMTTIGYGHVIRKNEEPLLLPLAAHILYRR